MAIDFAASDDQLDDTTHLVTVRGEVDLFTAPEFKERVTCALESGGPLVVVDLGGATFIDSSSLGVLISAQRRMARRDGRLVIACDAESLLRTFRITGLDGLLEIVPTRDDALALAAR